MEYFERRGSLASPMLKDQLLARAAEKRAKADRIEASLSAPSSAMAEHFPLGAGAARPSGERGHRSGAADARRDAAADRDLTRTSKAFRDIENLRAEAGRLEYRARHEVQADDLDGMRADVVKLEAAVADIQAWKASPERVAASVARHGAGIVDCYPGTLQSLRAQTRAARVRLTRAESATETAAA